MARSKAKTAPAVSDERLAQAVRDKAAEINALVGQLAGRRVEIHLGVRTRYEEGAAQPLPELVPTFRRFEDL